MSVVRGSDQVATTESVAELDAMPAEKATAALASLFEGASRFLGRLVAERPFGSWPALFRRAESIALAMPEDEQIELIDAHPRLGAPPATVSTMSFIEQGYDREAADSNDELGRLNDAYEARFGFRYCVHVAGRPRAELVTEMRAALRADREAERERALRAVVAIAADRQRKLSEATP